jgi:hypothetical protein
VPSSVPWASVSSALPSEPVLDRKPRHTAEVLRVRSVAIASNGMTATSLMKLRMERFSF